MKFRFFALALSCILLISSQALGATSATPGSTTASWKLQADRTAASHDNKYLEAFGNVVLQRGGDYIRADYARYYEATKWVYLHGSIEAKFQGDFMKAEEAEFDLNSNNGWLKNGQVFMEEPHMYFSGELLKKTGTETYEFREATVTVCDGEKPAWSIKATRGDITVDGYAHLWAPRLQAVDQPVFFSPYAVIPVKTKRQSGFLLPEIGTSERLGLTYDQPYYQVISEEQDATFYSHLMTSKGVMFGAEYRFAPDIHTKGVLQGDYLFDQEIEEESIYSDNEDMSRTNRNRWWVRGKVDGYLTDPEWNLKLDLDLVSDQDYLREFSHGYSGFNKTRDQFLQYFGRDINDNDDNLRLNRVLLSRNWNNIGFQGMVEYTQNLEYSGNSNLSNHGRAYDPTLQRLPELNLHLYQTEISETPFTAEGSAQLASFWREYGTRGARFDVHPLIGLPLQFNYLSIIPKVGFRGTAYMIDRFENDPAGVKTSNNTPFRFIPEITTSAYTEFYRVFDLAEESETVISDSETSWLKLRHAIQPRLEYNYRPYANQNEFPYFDDQDRIDAVNDLTYSLTNLFSAKMGRRLPDPTTPGASSLKIDYLDFLRLRLEQTYSIREAHRNDDLERYGRRPFSDILADLTLQLTPELSAYSKTWYSPYEGRVTEHEHGLTAFYDDRLTASFGFDFIEEIDEYARQEQDRMRIASFGLSYKFTEQWSAAALYRVDWEAGIDLEKRLGIRYDHQCFSAETSVSQTDDDTRFEFRIILAQLGSIGR